MALPNRQGRIYLNYKPMKCRLTIGLIILFLISVQVSKAQVTETSQARFQALTAKFSTTMFGENVYILP